MSSDVIKMIGMKNPRMFVMRMVCKNWNRWLTDAAFRTQWLIQYRVVGKHLTTLGELPYKGFIISGKKLKHVKRYKKGKVVGIFKFIKMENGYHGDRFHIYMKLDENWDYFECYLESECITREIRYVPNITIKYTIDSYGELCLNGPNPSNLPHELPKINPKICIPEKVRELAFEILK